MKRILIGLGSKEHSEAKLRYAIDLAQAHQAKITGVTVLDVDRLMHVGPIPLGGGAAAEDLREYRLNAVGEKIAEVVDYVQATCRDAGVACEVHQEEGDPFKLLVARARFQDIMLFGLHGVFEYDVVTDRAEHPIDLLIRFITAGVRPILAVNDNYRKIERVLVAYSGSVESARTVKHFVRLNPWPGAAVRVVTFDVDEAEGTQRLEDASDYCRDHGVDVETKLIQGPPKGHIIEEADDYGADVIVMGNSAKSLLSRKVFGETALHCLNHADRPVFFNQ